VKSVVPVTPAPPSNPLPAHSGGKTSTPRPVGPSGAAIRWLSTKDAAAHLGINTRTLRQHVAKGNIVCRRAGKLYKFELETLDEFAPVIDNR
jgi:excisionase family DNA binding protein